MAFRAVDFATTLDSGCCWISITSPSSAISASITARRRRACCDRRLLVGRQLLEEKTEALEYCAGAKRGRVRDDLCNVPQVFRAQIRAKHVDGGAKPASKDPQAHREWFETDR
jgi:hypothetical protein